MAELMGVVGGFDEEFCCKCQKVLQAPNSMTDPGVQDWPKDGLQSLQNGENSVLKIWKGVWQWLATGQGIPFLHSTQFYAFVSFHGDVLARPRTVTVQGAT